jgi:hypothetical protein
MPSDQPALRATVSLSYGTNQITLELSLTPKEAPDGFMKALFSRREAIEEWLAQCQIALLSHLTEQRATTSLTNPSPSSNTSSECSSTTPPPSSTQPAGVERLYERPKGYMDDEPSDSKSTQPPPSPPAAHWPNEDIPF